MGIYESPTYLPLSKSTTEEYSESKGLFEKSLTSTSPKSGVSWARTTVNRKIKWMERIYFMYSGIGGAPLPIAT
jgi:hypothetical protein